MNHETINFAGQLIKDRIAEVIFERMIREEGRYTKTKQKSIVTLLIV